MSINDWEAIFALLARDIPDPERRASLILELEPIVDFATMTGFHEGVRWAYCRVCNRSERARKLASRHKIITETSLEESVQPKTKLAGRPDMTLPYTAAIADLGSGATRPRESK